MRAFNISMNGKKLCVAGVGDRGLLSAIVCRGAGDRDEDLFLHVGGLVNEEHLDWIDHACLQIGDEIRVQICEVESGDDPSRKRRRDAPETLDGKKWYIRRIARELGWSIPTDPDNPGDPSAR
jgi:hypothetical protein